MNRTASITTSQPRRQCSKRSVAEPIRRPPARKVGQLIPSRRRSVRARQAAQRDSPHDPQVAEGKFVEHAEVHDNLYGTSHAAVQTVLSRGQCCILDIDVQGARSVRKSGLPAVFVFVAPPSFEVLEQRLR